MFCLWKPLGTLRDSLQSSDSEASGPHNTLQHANDCLLVASPLTLNAIHPCNNAHDLRSSGRPPPRSAARLSSARMASMPGPSPAPGLPSAATGHAGTVAPSTTTATCCRLVRAPGQGRRRLNAHFGASTMHILVPQKQRSVTDAMCCWSTHPCAVGPPPQMVHSGGGACFDIILAQGGACVATKMPVLWTPACWSRCLFASSEPLLVQQPASAAFLPAHIKSKCARICRVRTSTQPKPHSQPKPNAHKR